MITRRIFLRNCSAGGTGLVLGFHLGCGSSRPEVATGAQQPAPVEAPPQAPLPAESQINAWVRIGLDDTVTIIVPESEMGQGVLTSIPMIIADELEADWDRVRSEHAPSDALHFGRQGTGGSTSIRMGFGPMRQVGAAAREMLIAAAAHMWQVPAGECRAERGEVIHAGSQRRARFGELAAAAAKLEPPSNPPLKDPKDFKIIGTPARRLDLAAKLDGSAIYGIDVKVPGMLVAQVARPPVFGGKVARFDGSRAMAVPGVRNVVEIPGGVAVVADHFWAAKAGRDALVVEWDEGDWGQLSSAAITDMCKKLVSSGVDARNDGDAAGALAKARKAHRLTAVYQVPYLAHATMEPMNCTADVRADSCELWVGTQAQTGAHTKAAQICGLSPEKVQVHTAMLGGGFGRRSQVDFVEDALHLSKAVGKPVKVIWTREDDMRAGFYRPMAYNELSGALDGDGWPVAWVHRIASPAILEAFGPLPGGIDMTSVEGAKNLPYAIANVQVTYANPKLPIPLWFWRSVGSSQNAYVTECFFDELAALGKKDPFEARRRLLADQPRHKKVLEVAAEKAGWGAPLPAGRARGIAVHESFGSFVAEVAEVSLERGQVRVHRVVCATDCGQVVNPDTIAAQMDSAIAYGLSAALFGEIEIEKGRAVQGNFDTYRILRMHEMPVVETHLVPSGDAHGGVGEIALPPLAPAVCNAIRTLTKKPVRQLPIRLS